MLRQAPPARRLARVPAHQHLVRARVTLGDLDAARMELAALKEPTAIRPRRQYVERAATPRAYRERFKATSPDGPAEYRYEYLLVLARRARP